jgi:magnesium transporter
VDAHIVRGGVVRPEQIEIDALRRTAATLDAGDWLWVDEVDVADQELERLAGALDLHELAVEDVRHGRQRPKVEPYPGSVFGVFRALSCIDDEIVDRDVFVFASDRFLVTLRRSPAFDLSGAVKRWPVLHAIAPGTGSAVYAVVDELVDDYLEVVEVLEARADRLESKVFGEEPERPEGSGSAQRELLTLRREVVRLRRLAAPMRQAVDRLADDGPIVTERLTPYLRDVTDHLLRTIELADGVREILTTVLDIRVARSANQLNEVVKKLTAWAAIVLVPTLIAGIYGMNFRHMPELEWQLGYPLALGIMGLAGVLLYVGFRKRGWL